MTAATPALETDLMLIVDRISEVAVACGTRVETAVRERSVTVEAQKTSIGDLVTALDKAIEAEINAALQALRHSGARGAPSGGQQRVLLP